MQNYNLFTMQNDQTKLELNLDGGGIIWSLTALKSQTWPEAIQFVESRFNGKFGYGQSIQAALWEGGVPSQAYNPTQAGDKYENGSGVTKSQPFTPDEPGAIGHYTKTRALHYEPDQSQAPAPSDIIVRQWVTLLRDGAVKVTYKLTNTSGQTHAFGMQQVPVFHLASQFNAYYTHNSNGFEVNAIPYIDKPEGVYTVNTPEHWINIHDPALNNLGLTIFAVNSTVNRFHISYRGFVTQCQPDLTFGLGPDTSQQGVIGPEMEQTLLIIPSTPTEGRQYLVNHNYI